MASDWRIVPEPLGKYGCEGCGLGVQPATAAAACSLYADDYRLYAHPPGEHYEHERQRRYADWIGGMLSISPRRVLDVGCGNGSLLLALRACWPAADLLGCDPSAASVAEGAAHGLHLWRGGADTIPRGVNADLVVSVNVVEHVPDPVAFLAALRAALAPDGLAVIVCPDGARPGLELLFVDHLWSLQSHHLRMLYARAGLRAITAISAPDALGPFQMVIGRADDDVAEEWSGNDARRLNARRRAFLDSWARLDDALAARVPPRVVCFGTGETAGLLRAYAPETWQRVSACTADGVGHGSFGALPVLPLADVPGDASLLVAVRPGAQRAVAERLRRTFASVTVWYDLAGDEAGG